ncbi:MAG TPA: hypothetical protein VGM90_32425 [Kofleriaceae bacterium]|jgi:hypothetical protein
MKSLALVMVLAACGGGGGEKQPEIANTAPVSTAPVKMTREQVLAKTSTLRDRACACTDEACATSVKKELDAWSDHPAPMADAEIDKIVVDYDACIDSASDEHAILTRVDEMKDLMCACKDLACAQRVNDRYTDWGTKAAGLTANKKKKGPSDEAVKKITEVAMAYGECMTKAMTPAEAPAP